MSEPTDLMLVVIDADGLIALYDPEHWHHERAKNICHLLFERGVKVLIPITAACEAITVFQSKLNKPYLADLLAQKFQTGLLRFQKPDE